MKPSQVDEPEICVIGRCLFATGIGSITYSCCEMLSRSYPVGIFPTESELRSHRAIYLPNGRPIPVCTDLARIKFFAFADVLWNGPHDYNYLLVPDHGFRTAFIVYDSDEFP